MNKIISEEKNLRNELAAKLIRTNYELSGKEVLNPSIYKNPEKSLCFLMYDNNQMIGGINVIIDYYNWAHIYMTWVDERYRRHGIGSQIMDMVIQYAKDNNLTGIKTETWDFQAKGFYEKKGFKVYGTLENHPKGITEFYLYRNC